MVLIVKSGRDNWGGLEYLKVQMISLHLAYEKISRLISILFAADFRV